jgi:hypothetical protein
VSIQEFSPQGLSGLPVNLWDGLAVSFLHKLTFLWYISRLKANFIQGL